MSLPGAVRERRLNRLIVAVSILVPVLVAVLFYTPAVRTNLDVSALPRLNAGINSTVTVLLLAGFAFIRRKKVRAHRACMMTAFALSAVFLVSYVVYHSAAEHTDSSGMGWWRPIYLGLLLSHILTAVVILPLVLFTIARAISGRLEAHRRLARWTLPVWLYVSVTGVIVYLMIAPHYPHG